MSHQYRTAYIAFGANLSNPKETFLRVIDGLGRAGLRIDDVSHLWASPSWPEGQGAPEYLNAVIRVATHLDADALLNILLNLEANLGRVRSERNAPRTCDLDVIDFDGVVSDRESCTLPHPRMDSRAFVLRPMAEVAPPTWRHPVSGLTLGEMIERLDQPDNCSRIN